MRSTVILELLASADDPMRRIDLYREANEDDRFRKYDGRAFWVEDFSWYMSGLIEQGVVTKVKERNKVWYVITEKGLLRLTKRSAPKEHRTLITRRLRYHIEGNVRWKEDETEQIIAHLARELKDGKELVKQYYFRALVKDVAYNMEHGYRDVDEKKVALVHDKVGWNDDWEEKLQVEAQRLVQSRRRRSEREAAERGYDICFKCSSWIHRKDAVKVADELAERLGVETATVCCGCYDKLIGGELIAENNA